MAEGWHAPHNKAGQGEGRVRAGKFDLFSAHTQVSGQFPAVYACQAVVDHQQGLAIDVEDQGLDDLVGVHRKGPGSVPHREGVLAQGQYGGLDLLIVDKRLKVGPVHGVSCANCAL